MKSITKRYVIVAILLIACVAFWQDSLKRQAQANLTATLLAFGQAAPPPLYTPIRRPFPATKDLIEGQYQIYTQTKLEMEWDIAWVTDQPTGYYVLQKNGQRVEKTIWLDYEQPKLQAIIDHLAKLDTYR